VFFVIYTALILILIIDAAALIRYISTAMPKLNNTETYKASAWSVIGLITKLVAGSKTNSNFISSLLTISALIWWFNYVY
jgi:hypothetical protein